MGRRITHKKAKNNRKRKMEKKYRRRARRLLQSEFNFARELISADELVIPKAVDNNVGVKEDNNLRQGMGRGWSGGKPEINQETGWEAEESPPGIPVERTHFVKDGGESFKSCEDDFRGNHDNELKKTEDLDLVLQDAGEASTGHRKGGGLFGSVSSDDWNPKDAPDFFSPGVVVESPEVVMGLKETDSGTTIEDLPDDLILEIFLGLTPKALVTCLSVCNKWRKLIRSSDFSRVYSQPKACLLLRATTCRNDKPDDTFRICCLVDPHQTNSCTCNEVPEEIHVDAVFHTRVPLRHPPIHPSMAVQDDGWYKLKLNGIDQFNVVNACQGLVCLSNSANEPVMVLNPVTSEFIAIPPGTTTDRNRFVDSGFGYCQESHRYKVVRVYYERIPLIGGEDVLRRVAQVHIVGEDTWEEAGYPRPYPGKLQSPTTLNGNIHWLQCGFELPILRFEFARNEFGPFPAPPTFDQLHHNGKLQLRMSSLNHQLCLSVADDTTISLWIMKEYGNQTSWTSYVKCTSQGKACICLPLDYLSCGAIVVFSYQKDRANRHITEVSKADGSVQTSTTHYLFEAVIFNPSFGSLTDALNGSPSR
ncbi:OLC1v1000836C1 [Oldenlandia corymbosa var. corymbosa]|uniref:OLC1v1000836C1 n=1 Tax=Oldenlandia corymbosa var. corymbosa TaxID=529605 RepID=A0AAV1D463_OLDCO|nr:OLC1v1000836C1 [Oldenlandia corymbosa var. corymbosa]